MGWEGKGKYRMGWDGKGWDGKGWNMMDWIEAKERGGTVRNWKSEYLNVFRFKHTLYTKCITSI